MARPLNWDRVGAVASTVCAVHCVLTGVAFGLLSALGFGFLGNPWVDYTFLLLALVAGLTALIHGVRKHHQWGPATLYAGAMGLMLFTHFGPIRCCPDEHGHRHDALWTIAGFTFPATPFLSVLGGCALVAFHVWNLKLQHRHDAACACGGHVCEHPGS